MTVNKPFSKGWFCSVLVRHITQILFKVGASFLKIDSWTSQKNKQNLAKKFSLKATAEKPEIPPHRYVINWCDTSRIEWKFLWAEDADKNERTGSLPAFSSRSNFPHKYRSYSGNTGKLVAGSPSNVSVLVTKSDVFILFSCTSNVVVSSTFQYLFTLSGIRLLT